MLEPLEPLVVNEVVLLEHGYCCVRDSAVSDIRRSLWPGMYASVYKTAFVLS